MDILNDKDRCEILAEYLLENKSTVRATAANYGLSKSTVHKDVSHRLKKVNPILYVKVKKLLDLNKSQRHLRGGAATKLKYKQMKLKVNRGGI